MEKTDVLVIGGGPAGITAAVTGKASYPDKKFLLIRNGKQVVVPCGIPYVFGSLRMIDKDALPDTILLDAGVELRIDNVIDIDREKKICKTENGDEIEFEKLVFATGSVPVVPKWLKGVELENVFTVTKNKFQIENILNKLKDFDKIVTIGGGFIGVEVSDEINKLGKEVTIVEILPHILGLAFDEEITKKAEDILKSRGLKIKTGVGAKEILGKDKVDGVLLDNGNTLNADAVILSIGYHPNTDLAKRCGLKTNEWGFIRVDEYMRTDDPNIFAVGDCAEKRDFFTRKPSRVMLASTACAEARIAGMNLYKLSTVKTFSGTIAIFSTAIGDTGFGAVGLTETLAKKEGFDIATGSFEGFDKHPGTLPDTHKQMVKLIVARESGIILGGEIIGGSSIGELTNLMGIIVQNKMTVNSILTLQIGTHPMLTATPTAYPLIKAAETIVRNVDIK